MALDQSPRYCFATNVAVDRVAVKGVAFALAALVVALIAPDAFAQTADDFAKDPFKGPLQQLIAIFTGPIALAISFAGIVACGMMLIFGGEMKDFVKMMVTITLVICLIVGGAGILNRLFGFTEAKFDSPKFTFNVFHEDRSPPEPNVPHEDRPTLVPIVANIA